MKETDRAYLAGILDGEGCISVATRMGKYITPTVQVANTNFKLILWLQEHLGGTYYETPENRPTRRTCWLWRCAGDIARQTLKLAMPYLQLKNDQAKLALLYRPCKGSRRLTDQDLEDNKRIIALMRLMNKRGRETNGEEIAGLAKQSA